MLPLRPLDLPPDELHRIDRELVTLTRGYALERLDLGRVLATLGKRFQELGFRTFGTYVKERASENAGWCSEARALASRLEELPAITEALAQCRLGWSQAVLLSRHATADDEVELLDAVEGMSMRELRAALRVRGGAREDSRQEVEDEETLVPFVTIDVPVRSRVELLALEGVRLAIEHVNEGFSEPGEWFDCLLGEAASTMSSRLDVELPEVSGSVSAAKEARRAAVDVLAKQQAAARPIVMPVEVVFEERAPLELDAFDLVALDREVVQRSARLASRDVWLGRLLSRFLLAGGWRKLGYASEQHYFDERLGVARSTARGRVTLARRMGWLDGLDAAVSRGELGYQHASLVARVANPDTLDAWIARAAARTYKHLREDVWAAELRARVEGGSAVGAPPPSDDELEEVFAFERDVVSGAMIARATRGVQQRDVDGDEEKDAVQMSVVSARLRAGSYSVRVREDVALHYRALEHAYRAAGRPGSFVMFCVYAFWNEWGACFEVGGRWKVDVFDRDRHRCASPVCTSRVCTAHHMRYRAHGGGHEAENLITACEFCHLDGEHGGRLRVRGTASRAVWVFGRTPVLEVAGREKRAA